MAEDQTPATGTAEPALSAAAEPVPAATTPTPAEAAPCGQQRHTRSCGWLSWRLRLSSHRRRRAGSARFGLRRQSDGVPGDRTAREAPRQAKRNESGNANAGPARPASLVKTRVVSGYLVADPALIENSPEGPLSCCRLRRRTPMTAYAQPSTAMTNAQDRL
jgi:hypothetical protein